MKGRVVVVVVVEDLKLDWLVTVRSGVRVLLGSISLVLASLHPTRWKVGSFREVYSPPLQQVECGKNTSRGVAQANSRTHRDTSGRSQLAPGT